MPDLHRQPQKKSSIEILMIRLTMLVALTLSGWMIYHFVKLAAIGIAATIP